MISPRRAAAAFILSLIAGLGGEAILLGRQDLRGLEENLKKDFHLLLFSDRSVPQARLEELENRLAALPGVANARLSLPEDSLAFLEKKDPALAQSLALLSADRLEPMFDLEPSQEGLDSFPALLSAAQAQAPWTGTVYSRSQLRFLLRLRLGVRFSDLVLSALGGLSALTLAAGLLAPFFTRPPRGSGKSAARANRLDSPGLIAAFLGSLAGIFLAVLFAWPLQTESPWRIWPHLFDQALLLALSAGFCGVLCSWPF